MNVSLYLLLLKGLGVTVLGAPASVTIHQQRMTVSSICSESVSRSCMTDGIVSSTIHREAIRRSALVGESMQTGNINEEIS